MGHEQWGNVHNFVFLSDEDVGLGVSDCISSRAMGGPKTSIGETTSISLSFLQKLMVHKELNFSSDTIVVKISDVKKRLMFFTHGWVIGEA